MKVIWQRVKEEPAVAIGLLVSLALLAVALIKGDTEWDVTTILFIIGPFAAALGIRPVVKPMAKIKREQKDKARERLQPR